MRVSIITALLAESDLISVLAVALPLFVTTLTVARNRLSGEQTSLIFIDVFMKILRLYQYLAALTISSTNDCQSPTVLHTPKRYFLKRALTMSAATAIS